MKRRLIFALVTLGCAATQAPPQPGTEHDSGRAGRECASEFEVLGDGTCFLAPPDATSSTPVILFFHGIYAADSPQAEMAIEGRLARAARAAGYAVLAPRGEIGACDWSPELARWRCWPNTPAGVGRVLASSQTFWRPAHERLRAATRIVPFVMGYSNGGYFAAGVAAEARMQIAAFAILHGGAIKPANFEASRARPTLLIAAEGDEHQRPRMNELAEILERVGWPRTYEVRAGGHGLTDDDIARTLRFFDEVRASR